MYFVIVEPHAALYRYLPVAHKKGYKTLVLSAKPEECRAGEASYYVQAGHHDQPSMIDELIECNTAAPEDIVAALTPLRDTVAGILPGSETAVTPTFQAAAALGFDGPRPEDALCLHVKSAMKERLAERGVPTPRFEVVHTLDQAVAAWELFGRDCMIKMVDYSSSANIYRVHTLEQVSEAWETISGNRLELESVSPLATWAVVEEYLDGREVTAEGYATDDKVVVLNSCEKSTSERFLVVEHYVPGLLTEDERAKVESVAKDCVRALGIRNTAFHAEINLHSGEPYVIECAARPPGMHIAELITWAYGYDLLDISIDLAAGKDVTIGRIPPKKHYALLSVHAGEPGIFEGLEGVEELRERGVLKRLHLSVHPGDVVNTLTDFRKRCGFVVIEEDTADGLRDQVKWVRENVHVVVNPAPSAAFS